MGEWRSKRKDLPRKAVNPRLVIGGMRVALEFMWGVMETILTRGSNKAVWGKGLPIAREMVFDIQTRANHLTGQEKREMAVRLIVQRLIGEEKIAETEITASLINLMVEVAVNEMKK